MHTPKIDSQEMKKEFFFLEETDVVNEKTMCFEEKCYEIVLPLDEKEFEVVKLLAEINKTGPEIIDNVLHHIFYIRLSRVSEIMKKTKGRPVNVSLKDELVRIEVLDEDENTVETYEILLPLPLAIALKEYIENRDSFSIFFAYWNGILWKVGPYGFREIKTAKELFSSTLCYQHECPHKHGIDFIVFPDGKIEILDEFIECKIKWGEHECKKVLKELYPNCKYL